MTPALIGIAVGAVGGARPRRGCWTKLVFGVSASDPLTLAAVAGSWRWWRCWRAWCPPTAPRGWTRLTVLRGD